MNWTDRLKGLGRYLLNRAGERSTWQGLAAAATATGIAVSPEQVEAITATGLAVVGLLHVLIPDPKP